MALMVAELVLEIMLSTYARTHCQYCVGLQKKTELLTEHGNRLLQLEGFNLRTIDGKLESYKAKF